MNTRHLLRHGLAIALVVATPSVLSAQFDPFGARQSTYWRVGAGVSNAISPSGVYEDFNRGLSINVASENWRPDADGNEREGGGFAIGYTRFPLNQGFFNQTFEPNPSDPTEHPTSSSGSGSLYTFMFQFLRRLPLQVLSPSGVFGLGLFDLARANVNYQSASGAGSSSLPERYGIMGSLGLTVDQNVTSNVGVFAEGMYSIALDISTVGYAVRSATCAGASCAPVQERRWAPLGDVRAGVRFRTH